MPGVLMMRDLADADALSAVMTEGARVLVIGGGYIGLEAAAEASKKGLDVTVIEMAERILQRVASKATSDYFRTLHQSRGVRIEENLGLVRLQSGNDFSHRGELERWLDPAFRPGDRWHRHSAEQRTCRGPGLGIELDAIAVDEFGQTSDPAVYAPAIARHFSGKISSSGWNRSRTPMIRARSSPLNMLGQNQPYRPEPWFWSDQFDVKLQIAGLNLGYDDVVCRKRAMIAAKPISTIWARPALPSTR